MKILILGSSGMLGYSLFKNLSYRKDLQVSGTLRNLQKYKPFYSNEEFSNLIHYDALTSKNNLVSIIEKIRPEYVINCIGLIHHKESSNNFISKYISLNSLFPHLLAETCEITSSKLIHFSTDCVFSGRDGMYNEADIPDATDFYGRSKLLGEINYGNHLTLRTSIIGHEIDSNIALVDWFLNKQGKIKGFSNAFFSGMPTQYISEIISQYIVGKNIKGLYHLSVNPISKYELLRKIAKVYKKEIQIDEDKNLDINKSLDATKFIQLTGYKPPSWDELIELMYKDYCSRYNMIIR